MTKDQREELWAAINHYAVSCGGSPATRVSGNEARQRAVTRIERVVNAIELTWMGPIRCAECGGTDDAPLKVGCSGVIHDNEASEISLGSAATRNVAPEQNQAVTNTEPGQGKSNGSAGKSLSHPGKSDGEGGEEARGTPENPTKSPPLTPREALLATRAKWATSAAGPAALSASNDRSEINFAQRGQWEAPDSIRARRPRRVPRGSRQKSKAAGR